MKCHFLFIYINDNNLYCANHKGLLPTFIELTYSYGVTGGSANY